MELSERCIQTLEKEGWPHIYEWSDGPGVAYPPHEHEDKVVLFVTEGSLELAVGETVHKLRPGDRYDIPPQTQHNALVGPTGCQYVIGEMVAGDS